MSLVLTSPFEIFADTAGKPLENGYLYIGVANLNAQSNPITVYWDSALTIPASQPIRTSGGYPWLNGTARNVYIPGAYSIIVKDKNQKLVFSADNPASDLGSGILTLLKTVDGSGSGLISEGLQSIEITDLDFDPTLLGLIDREVRSYSTSFGPANQPNNSIVDYFAITLTKVNATSFILSMDGRDLSNLPTGGHFTRYWTAGAWGGWRWFTDDYDFVVDSNQALDQWIAHTGGLYRRVLVKAGTWTATALGATAGTLLDLDTSGTRYVFGEAGSEIVFSGGFAGTMVGIGHAVLPTDPSSENFYGVKVTLTNTTATRGARAFQNMLNLVNCTGTGTGNTSGAGNGFSGCYNHVNCSGVGVSTSGTGAGFNGGNHYTNCTGVGTATSGVGAGFNGGNDFVNCTGTGTATTSGTGAGFISTTKVTNCTGVGNGGSTGTGYGFRAAFMITNSQGTGNGGSVSGAGAGFSICTQVSSSQGVGAAVGAGTGHGFSASVNLQQNRALSASKTATFDATCFAGSAANAPADTAAGGYNLP